MTKLCIHIYQYFRSHRVTFWSMMVGVFLFAVILLHKFIWRKI